MNWSEAKATIRVGDSVRFITSWDIYPYCIIPEDTCGTVTETSAEQNGMIYVLPEDTRIQDILREWSGAIQVWALEDTDECPLAKL